MALIITIDTRLLLLRTIIISVGFRRQYQTSIGALCQGAVVQAVVVSSSFVTRGFIRDACVHKRHARITKVPSEIYAVEYFV
jgi:hypothetical protein